MDSDIKRPNILPTSENPYSARFDRAAVLRKRLPSGIRESCFDRATLITEGYKRFAADPIILRRAKALAHVLDHLPIRIFEEELIVGDQSVSHQAGHNYPEFGHWFRVGSRPQRVPRSDRRKRLNLALLPNATANASSVLPGHSQHQIAHLNDGFYNNANSWISNGEPSWVEIDLGEAMTVSAVALGSEHVPHYQDRAVTRFDILLSTDYHVDSSHPSWQKMHEYQGEPVHTTRTFSFKPVKARWVRIQIWESEGGNARVDEIEIYGDRMAEEGLDDAPDEPSKADALAEQLAEVAEFWQEHPRLRAVGSLFGHTVPGFQKLLDKGFEGIAAEAQAKLDQLDPTDAEQIATEPFWQAMVILCRAAGNFGRRHAEEARRMAAIEPNPRRKGELLRIADVCEQVPAHPARTFHEAVQSLWFGHMLIELEDPPNAHSIGRLDQLLFPFYQRDLEAGRLTKEAAYELLECFALKIWKSYDVQDTMLGGQKSDGTDGVNDISFLYLDVVESLDLHLQISARYHRGTDPAFWRRVAEVNARGRGLPQMFSDEVIIPALVRKGIPLEDARNYAVIGCIELTIPGRCDPRVVNHYTNLAKCLEYALNDGVCLLTGKQQGLRTGDPAGFCTYEELWEAYKAQVAHEVRSAVPHMHRAELEQRERFPMPLLSALTDDCIGKGLDITAGGARYNSTGVCGYGMANVGDSLAAIKKLVFEEGRLTLMEVVTGMRTNFEDNEPLRQLLLNGAPKYGNDSDEVDPIVAEVCRHFCEVLEPYRNPRGGRYHAHLFSFVIAVHGGAQTGASADGRKAGEPVANSLAPQQGRDRNGITAFLKSVSKVDQTLAAAGTSLIFDLHPSGISGVEGVEKLDTLLRTYLELGGGHVECNIVDADLLRQAQREPEKYAHLSVRVAGYSAYFVTLDKAMQDHIIEKTKNVL